MKIQHIKITDLQINDLNPRKISEEQLDQLKQSLLSFGFVDPIIVNAKNGSRIVGGHQRVKAWGELGNDEVPAVVLELSDDEERELNIRLNANGGDWDENILKEFFDVNELDDWGFGLDDLESIFEEEDFDKEPFIDPDTIPIGEVTVAEGEVWQLGKNRLAIGSSLDAELVAKLFNDDRANCIWTDPPYNVNYQSKAGSIDNDNMSSEDFRQFLTEAFDIASAFCDPNASLYVAYASKEVVNFSEAIVNAGFDIRQHLIWVKNRFILGRQDYHWQHEPIIYGWKTGASHNWYADRTKSTVIQDHIDELSREDLLSILKGYQTDVIEIDAPTKNDIHPTMKPVELIKGMLRNSTKKGDLIYDPFSGSGSTLIASDILRRKCYAIELDSIKASASIKRWEDVTGEKAVKL